MKTRVPPLRRLIGRLFRKIRRVNGALDRRLYVAGIKSARRLSLPHFIGIGAQRAGSTWLYDNLSCHPELFLAQPKELHYFDWHYYHSLRWYAKHFSAGHNRVRGEITPGYSIIPSSRIKFISAMMPSLKVIFLLRNPIDRAWSQALMNLVRLPKRSVEDVPLDEFLGELDRNKAVARGDYLDILRRWTTAYPSEQIFLALFDRIAQEPQALLNEVLRFLGVTPPPTYEGYPWRRVSNQNPQIRMPDSIRQHLVARYAPQIAQLRATYGEKLVPWQI